MTDGYVTITDFKKEKRRIDRIESILEVSGIKETKEEIQEIEKEIAITDTKIDSFRREFRTEMESLRNEIKSLEKSTGTEIKSLEKSTDKRYDMMWKLQLLTLGALIGLYLKGLIF